MKHNVNLSEDIRRRLIQTAMAMRERSYSPYSHYTVGAAVLTPDGSIYHGCNIENASYPVGICAERTAIAGAVADGHRSISAVVLSGGREGQKADPLCFPCGMCLQTMTEFAGPDLPVLLAADEDHVTEFCLADLLPHVFDGMDHKKE